MLQPCAVWVANLSFCKMEPASRTSTDSYQALTFPDKGNISSYVVFLCSFRRLTFSPLLYSIAVFTLAFVFNAKWLELLRGFLLCVGKKMLFL